MVQVQNIPIQLVSSCSTLGDFTPLSFRYEDNTHHIHTVHITDIIHKKENHYNGIHEPLFTCTSKELENTRYFELKYNINTHKWSIFRMIF